MSRVWWSRALCPRMLVDILGTNCDQCQSTVQYCFTSMETIRLIRMESPRWPPQFSHSSWTLTSEFQDKHTVGWFPRQGNRFQTKKPNLHQIWFSDDRALIIAKILCLSIASFHAKDSSICCLKILCRAYIYAHTKTNKIKIAFNPSNLRYWIVIPDWFLPGPKCLLSWLRLNESDLDQHVAKSPHHISDIMATVVCITVVITVSEIGVLSSLCQSVHKYVAKHATGHLLVTYWVMSCHMAMLENRSWP